MFLKKKKYKLEDFIKNRKERVSLFGVSISFDWFILTSIFFVVMVIVFIFSVDEMNSISEFDIKIEEEINSQENKDKIVKEVDKILKKFEEKDYNLKRNLVD